MTDTPFPPHSRVVAYLRDSGGDDQDLSVPQQREYLSKWCEENELVLIRIFADVARPGSSTIGRGQFRDMIDHFRDAHCTDAGLILWKFSRFSRDIDDAQYFRADLRRRGYIVYSIQDKIPDTTDGRIYEALLDWMNNKFREDMAIDVSRGLQFNASTYGAIPGTPPFGFIREELKIGKRRDGSEHIAGRWVPDPEKIDICRRAFELRAQGASFRKIHGEFHIFRAINSYTTFFTNRIYLGEMRYGNVFIEKYAEPVITQEVWDMVQARNRKNSVEYDPLKREVNRQHPRRDNSSFVFSGIIFCPRCGSIMNGISITPKNGKKSEYYACSRAKRNMDCDAKMINKKKLEDAVIEKILEFVLDPEVIQERDAELALSQNGDQKSIEREIRRVTAELRENEKLRERVARHLMATDEESPTLTKNLTALESEERELRAKLNRFKSIKNHETVFVRDLEDLEELSKQFSSFLTGDDLEKRRWAVRFLVHRIVAEKDGENIIGMVSFYNPHGSGGNLMSMGRATTPDPIYRHKIYSFTFVITQTPSTELPRTSCKHTVPRS